MQEIVQQSDVFTVDANYVREQLAAIHLVRSNGRVAIIDTGTQYSIPLVESALHNLGMTFDHVDYILLTHIHLDHAGGAGVLMQQCENAKLVVHERGARHIADPSKLIAGTVAVYGQDAFDKMYGTIEPVDAERIVIPEDGEVVEFQHRSLTFLDSPGHAKHHHCIVDSQTGSIFTGDTLGISYPGLRDGELFFLMPTTTPVQFEPDALHASIDKIMSWQPEYLYLTHYSAVRPTARHIEDLHAHIDEFVRLTKHCAEQYADDSESLFADNLAAALTDYMVTICRKEMPRISTETAQQLVQLDSRLSAQGLVFWWNHRRGS